MTDVQIFERDRFELVKQIFGQVRVKGNLPFDQRLNSLDNGIDQPAPAVQDRCSRSYRAPVALSIVRPGDQGGRTKGINEKNQASVPSIYRCCIPHSDQLLPGRPSPP